MVRKGFLAMAVLAAAMAAPAGALAAPPYSYHTIANRDAYAFFDATSGDLGIAVWVSGTDARMSLKPSGPPLNGAFGLTSVTIIVVDLTRPTGKGYVKLADWDGQVAVAPTFHGALDRASLLVDVPVTDAITGAGGVAEVSIAWTASGPSATGPEHLHLRWPGELILNSNSNDNERPAIAEGSVRLAVAGLLVNGPDSGAMLHSTKFNCRQIGYRTLGDVGVCI